MWNVAGRSVIALRRRRPCAARKQEKKMSIDVKQDRALRGGTESEQRYTVNVVITAERDLERMQ